MNELQRAVRWFVAATVVLYLALGALATFVLVDAQNTNKALCAMRLDYERRVAATREYLREHPEGIPGIATAQQIRNGIADQQRTIDALSTLRCG